MPQLAPTAAHPLLPFRSSILSIIKLLFLALANLPFLRASPLRSRAENTHWATSTPWESGVLKGAFSSPARTIFSSHDGKVSYSVSDNIFSAAADSFFSMEEPAGKKPDDPTLWIYLAVAMALVLAGGAFAGLTIALMGQDEIYLQVIKTSGEGSERKHAARVLKLLKRGKHWVLVTLLLSNVITNETLPIVLDRSLGGGWPAVLGSTVLIVIFGEIIPQSICVRYGLPIGAWMSAPVMVLMYLMAPVAWPTAKLLDYLLGTDHGTTYKKAGLKTLVTLHKTIGEAGEQLNHDEVTIISAVLDLKDKPVGAIMTPMDDVFTMSANTVLDEKTMNVILSAGYSRIPIHAPDNPLNFIGMLLVKMLITYDPEDCKPVRDFALATLPETRPETSCLDIVNYFQEGKSHMVLVTDNPGEDWGALGVVTLEDVIEELIGEEIVDESDVFMDVHKAIRRLTPTPWYHVPRGEVIDPPVDGEEALVAGGSNGDPATTNSRGPNALKRLLSLDTVPGSQPASSAVAPPSGRPRQTSSGDLSRSPLTTVRFRRSSSITGQSDGGFVTRRTDAPDLRDHLKHLGPSNLASRPKSTRYASVKIKQVPTSHALVDPDAVAANATESDAHAAPSGANAVTHPAAQESGGVGEGIVPSAGMPAKDGVIAVQQGQGYGTISGPGSQSVGPVLLDAPTIAEEGETERPPSRSIGMQVDIPPPMPDAPEPSPHGGSHRHHSRHGSSTGAHLHPPTGERPHNISSTSVHSHGHGHSRGHGHGHARGGSHSPYYSPRHISRHHSRTHSASTMESVESGHARERDRERTVSSHFNRPVRSGSITENIVESGGFRKVVLEMTSSESSTEERNSPSDERPPRKRGSGDSAPGTAGGDEDRGHGSSHGNEQSSHSKAHGRGHGHDQHGGSEHAHRGADGGSSSAGGAGNQRKRRGKKGKGAAKVLRGWKERLDQVRRDDGDEGEGDGGREEGAPLLGGR